MSIKIENIDSYRCFVCDKPFLHQKRYSPHEKGIKVVELVMAHAGCRNMQTQIETLKENIENATVLKKGHSAEVREITKYIKETKVEITDLEYKMFMRKYSA